MLKIKMSVLLLLLPMVCAHAQYSQDSTRGQWSLMVQGGMNTDFGLSAGLQGNPEDFTAELESSGNYSKLPFGGGKTTTFSVYEMLSYRLPQSNLSLYSRYGITLFHYDKGIRGVSIQRNDSQEVTGLSSVQGTITFSAVALTLGAEYTFGEYSDIFNLFFRAGIGFYLIGADLNYRELAATTYSGARWGFEIETGGRVHIPGTPLAVELSAAYVNPNLIGKSYDGSNLINLALGNPYINDGEGGGTPSKSFDFFSLRAGARLFF